MFQFDIGDVQDACQDITTINSMAERVKAPLLRPHNRNRMILVHLPPSLHTLLRPWIKTLYDDNLYLVASNKQQIN